MYPFPPPAEAAVVTVELLRQPNDVMLNSQRNPLWRLTETHQLEQDYNVVLIIMEGMTGAPVGAMGLGPSQTPFLDRLCEQGLFFERMYAVGTRTSRGLVGILCGHPDLGGPSLLKRFRSQGNCQTLPGVFRRRGYRTSLIYGGSPTFDNVKGFLGAAGVQKFVLEGDMNGPEELRSPGGYHDEIILRKAHETFLSMGKDRFFSIVLTVSNHRPFNIPPGRVKLIESDDEKVKRLNGYRYADWALGEFFQMARGAPYFSRTIFVLVADHPQVFNESQLMDVVGYRVPCVIYAPGLIESGRIGVVTSQTDIAPTVLGLLGGQYKHCFLGRDARNIKPGEGFALLHDNDRLAAVRGDHALVLPPERPGRLFEVGLHSMTQVDSDADHATLAESLQLDMLSYYQMSRQLYWTCSYQDPADAPHLPLKE